MLKFFEKAINKLIALDPYTVERAQDLNHKIINITITGLQLYFSIRFIAGKIQLAAEPAIASDAQVSGTPLALMQLLLARQPNQLLFNKVVSIDGDIHVLQDLQRLLSELDIDWEEHLSRFVGDVPAHLVGNAVRGAKSWRRQRFNSFKQNMTEYVQEELAWLPPREEVNDFMNDVDQLREDVDRLETRYNRLKMRESV